MTTMASSITGECHLRMVYTKAIIGCDGGKSHSLESRVVMKHVPNVALVLNVALL